MKSVEKVKLVFENCETIEFEGNELTGLWFDKVYKRKYMHNENKMLESDHCEHFNVGIKMSANKPFRPFGVKDAEPNMKFNRINEQSDLVAVRVYYSDETEDYIYVPWDDEKSDYVNHKQQVTNDEDYLYILVK
jgi:hypothetical protein